MIHLGFFIAAFGAMYQYDDKDDGLPIPALYLLLDLLITFGSMAFRSVKDDHGFHIHKEDLIDDKDKGGRHNAVLKKNSNKHGLTSPEKANP